MSLALIDLRLRQIRLESEGICSYEFVAAHPGQVLPPFTAGAHIDLHLPDNRIRSYSLANPPHETGRYLVAVQREEAGRGGSAWMHDHLRVGQVLQSSAPANDFALNEAAAHSVFIAGGIGITPMLSMIARLEALGRSWTLHYATRSRPCSAFVDTINDMDNGRGRVVHAVSQVAADELRTRLDIAVIAREADAQTHLYCCGPTRMIDAFTAATASRNPATVHFERFGAAEAPALEGGFEVVLASSGRRIAVPAGKTILDALLDSDVSIPYACSNGVCGTCLTGVISGKPDHRDEFLSPDEKKLGRSIVLCCSGSCSPVLELDL